MASTSDSPEIDTGSDDNPPLMEVDPAVAESELSLVAGW